MKRIDDTAPLVSRRQFSAMAGAGLVAGCVAPGVVTRDGDPFEGGIGGTGIVGLLTDLGSLRINGLRVETSDRTVVQTPFGVAGQDILQPGMGLTVFARASRDRLIARNVQVNWPLIGRVRPAPGGLTVNGVRIVAESGAIGRARPGTRVAVSGVWSPSGVVASRFDPAGDLPALIGGDADRTSDGALAIGGVPVSLPSGSAAPVVGSYVTATGAYDGATFLARTVSEGRFVLDGAPLAQLSVEGFLRPVSADPGYRIAGLGHSFADGLSLAPLAAARAVYFGRYDGDFRASAGYVLPEDFGARRILLSHGIDAGYPGRVVPV